MRYKLREDLVLRGWEKLPYALQDTGTGHTEFLDELTFRALSFCDGQMDADSPLLLPAHREIISKLAENKAVVPCRAGDGLMPHQKYRLFPSRYIQTAHWSVTGRCNYKCRHCYMSAPDAKYGELSREQCMDIIDQLQGCGIRNVTLTGGEALVRSDFWEIVDRLIAYGIRINVIYSNGRLVTPETLDALERRGIYPEFSMSFDGVGWHDWLRGVEGAEREVTAALELCRERGFSTSSEMCLHRRNKHTLRESVNFLASKGLSALKTNPVSTSGAWIENAGGDTLSASEMFEIYLDYIPHFFEDGAPLNLQLGGFFMADKGAKEYTLPSVKADGSENAKRMAICGHARIVMYISAEGRILPCMSLTGLDVQKDFPLVTEMRLADCLTDSVYMDLISTTVGQFMEKTPECGSCEHKYFCCSGCRASAIETNGGLMCPDGAVCTLFKGGYIPRILEAAKGYKCANMGELP